MSFEKDINEIKIWARDLGVPSEILPNDETLKLILRSPQSNVIQNLINKVKTTKDTENIRNNILISKMEKIKEMPVITKSFKSHLPQKMQRYEQIKQIQKKIDTSEATILEDEAEVDQFRKKLKEKNIRQLRLMKREDNLRTKIKVYEGKKIVLNDALEKETKIAKKINKIFPAVDNPETNSCQTVQDVVDNYIRKIRIFYDIDTSEEKGVKHADEEKAALWAELTETTKSIPNSVLFSVLLNHLEMNSNELTSLVSNFKIPPSANQTKHVDSGFCTALTKEYARHIRRQYKANEAAFKNSNLKKEYCEIFQKFSYDLEKKCTLLPDYENANSILDNFIENYSKKLFCSGQCNFGLEQIEILKKKIKENETIVKEHEKLIDDTNTLYKEIEIMIFRLQDDCLKLDLLKEKLDSVKTLTENSLLDVVKVKSQQRPINYKNENFNNDSFRNRSVSLNNLSMSDSFNRIKNNQLCSTLNDCMSTSSNDVSFKMAKTTSEKQSTRLESIVSKLPCYTKEITAFAEISLELFKPKMIHYENLSSIFDVNVSVADKDANIFFEIIPEHLLTINGSLEEFKKYTNFYYNLKTITTYLHGNLNLIKVDKEQTQKSAHDQERNLTELFETMKRESFKCEEILKTIESYYDFLLKTPLSKYVSRTILFNGKTYQDYESEYLMYYRLLNE